MKKTLKAFQLGYLLFEYRYEPWSKLGRFGGGWNYHLGFMLGRGCLSLCLLVAEIRITIVECN